MLRMKDFSFQENEKAQKTRYISKSLRIIRTQGQAEIDTNPLGTGIGYLKSNEELKVTFPMGILASKLVQSQEIRIKSC